MFWHILAWPCMSRSELVLMCVASLRFPCGAFLARCVQGYIHSRADGPHGEVWAVVNTQRGALGRHGSGNGNIVTCSGCSGWEGALEHALREQRAPHRGGGDTA